MERLASGFFNISGATVDASGQLYFVDAHWQRIYKWSPEAKEAAIVRDKPLDPVNFLFDKAGDLIVVSYGGNGTVYSFRPDSPGYEMTLLKPEATADRSAMSPFLAADVWGTSNFTKTISSERPFQYLSPDHTVFIPAGDDFVQGRLYYGTKMADILRAFSIIIAVRPAPCIKPGVELRGNFGIAGAPAVGGKPGIDRPDRPVRCSSRERCHLAGRMDTPIRPSGKQESGLPPVIEEAEPPACSHKLTLHGTG